MCGIAYVKRKDNKPARKMTLKRYRLQKTRGQQGYGYVSAKDNVIVNIGRSEDEEGIEKIMKDDVANEILFHHRFPTSTPNFIEATHPIRVNNSTLKYEYYVVHNGIIHNDEFLKEAHEKLGFLYTTEIKKKWITRDTIYTSNYFNDSEALAVEIALVLEGKKEKIEARGSIAFIAYRVNIKDQKLEGVYYGRNFGNPLIVNDKDDFITITSEGSGSPVIADTLCRLDPVTNIITEKKLDIGIYPYPSKTSQHESYTGAAYRPTNMGFGTDLDDIKYDEDETRKIFNHALKKGGSTVETEPSVTETVENYQEELDNMLLDLYDEEEVLHDELKWAKDNGDQAYEAEVNNKLITIQSNIAKLEDMTENDLFALADAAVKEKTEDEPVVQPA